MSSNLEAVGFRNGNKLLLFGDSPYRRYTHIYDDLESIAVLLQSDMEGVPKEALLGGVLWLTGDATDPIIARQQF